MIDGKMGEEEGRRKEKKGRDASSLIN